MLLGDAPRSVEYWVRGLEEKCCLSRLQRSISRNLCSTCISASPPISDKSLCPALRPADQPAQHKHLTRRHPPAAHQITERRFRVFVHCRLVWADRGTGSIATVIDQRQVRTDLMEIGHFSLYHIFQDMSVAVKYENDFPR